MRTTHVGSAVVLMVVTLVAAGCGGGASTAPDTSGLAALDAQATLAVWSARETAVAGEARRAAQATTDAANAAAEATRVAQSATAAAVEAANATVAANATAVAVDAARMAAGATATWDALTARQMAMGIEATATADAAALAFQEAQAAKALAARQAEIDRGAMWTRLLPWLAGAAVFVVLVVVLVVVGAWALPRILQARPHQAGDVWVMVGPKGPVVLNHPPKQLSARPDVPLLAAGPSRGTDEPSPATWSHFARWSSSTRLPLGVSTSSEAILLDTQVSPHLFIAGSSRRGKTSGGLVPYIAWSLSVGFNVLLLGERAADFGAFYEHPNVTNLRAFSDEERVELTQAALEATRREMERRDQLLHAAGLNSWRELLLREPGEAGQLVVAVDEFLALATMGGTTVHRSMMQNVASLTSQAGKFGIGLVLAATDPRREALGSMGYLAIKQCARMAFGFNDRGSSRSVLGDDAAYNLPQGVFIYEDTTGRRHRGAAFHPSVRDVRALLAARPVAARELPAALRDIASQAVDSVDVWSGANNESDVIPLPAPGQADRAHGDPLLHGLQTSRGFVSPSEVGRILEAARMGLPHYRIEEHAFGKKNGAHYYMAEDVLRYFQLSGSTASTVEVER